MKLVNISLATLLVAALTGATALAAKESPAFLGTNGTVNFLAVGKPSMLKIRGEAAGAEGKLRLAEQSLQGEVSFDLAKLDTGIALRNEHMKTQYLEVQHHPKAVLKVIEAPVGADFPTSLASAEEKPFKGTLNMHGKEQPVNGTFTVQNGIVQAKFAIALTDFDIKIPSYLGVTVAKDVDVKVELPLKRE